MRINLISFVEFCLRMSSTVHRHGIDIFNLYGGGLGEVEVNSVLHYFI